MAKLKSEDIRKHNTILKDNLELLKKLIYGNNNRFYEELSSKAEKDMVMEYIFRLSGAVYSVNNAKRKYEHQDYMDMRPISAWLDYEKIFRECRDFILDYLRAHNYVARVPEWSDELGRLVLPPQTGNIIRIPFELKTLLWYMSYRAKELYYILFGSITQDKIEYKRFDKLIPLIEEDCKKAEVKCALLFEAYEKEKGEYNILSAEFKQLEEKYNELESLPEFENSERDMQMRADANKLNTDVKTKEISVTKAERALKTGEKILGSIQKLLEKETSNREALGQKIADKEELRAKWEAGAVAYYEHIPVPFKGKKRKGKGVSDQLMLDYFLADSKGAKGHRFSKKTFQEFAMAPSRLFDALYYDEIDLLNSYPGEKHNELAQAIRYLVAHARDYDNFLDLFGGSGRATLAVQKSDRVDYYINEWDYTNINYYKVLSNKKLLLLLKKYFKKLQDNITLDNGYDWHRAARKLCGMRSYIYTEDLPVAGQTPYKPFDVTEHNIDAIYKKAKEEWLPASVRDSWRAAVPSLNTFKYNSLSDEKKAKWALAFIFKYAFSGTGGKNMSALIGISPKEKIEGIPQTKLSKKQSTLRKFKSYNFDNIMLAHKEFSRVKEFYNSDALFNFEFLIDSFMDKAPARYAGLEADIRAIRKGEKSGEGISDELKDIIRRLGGTFDENGKLIRKARNFRTLIYCDSPYLNTEGYGAEFEEVSAEEKAYAEEEDSKDDSIMKLPAELEEALKKELEGEVVEKPEILEEETKETDSSSTGTSTSTEGSATANKFHNTSGEADGLINPEAMKKLIERLMKFYKAGNDFIFSCRPTVTHNEQSHIKRINKKVESTESLDDVGVNSYADVIDLSIRDEEGYLTLESFKKVSADWEGVTYFLKDIFTYCVQNAEIYECVFKYFEDLLEGQETARLEALTEYKAAVSKGDLEKVEELEKEGDLLKKKELYVLAVIKGDTADVSDYLTTLDSLEVFITTIAVPPLAESFIKVGKKHRFEVYKLKDFNDIMRQKAIMSPHAKKWEIIDGVLI